MLYTTTGLSQNLVPNHSFEIYSPCPDFLSGLSHPKAPPWRTPFWANFYATDRYSTPDIFNPCSDNDFVGVPKNFYGFQFPQHGMGYAGMITQANGDNIREYLQVRLHAPLVAGHMYYTGFYFNLGNRNCPNDRIGLYFSNDTIPIGQGIIFDYIPHIETNQGWLSDTVDWMLLEGCYIADGGESYITIGNFQDDDESNFLMPCDQVSLAYYYIDNVFVMDMSNPDLGDDFSLCNGDEITLSVSAGNSNYVWQDQSTADSMTITTPGIYHVTVSNVCGTNADTVIVSAETDPPVITLPAELLLCAGESITLDPEVANVTYAWSDGSDLSQFIVTEPGTYGLTVSNGCGSDVAQVTVLDAGSPPVVDLGQFISICPGEMLLIEPSYTNVDQWLWYDGSTQNTILINTPGTIYVQVSNECGTDADTVQVNINSSPPVLDLGPDLTACAYEVVVIPSSVLGVAYLWHDGSTAPSFTTDTAGMFHLKISNACGESSDSITVAFFDPPVKPQLGNDTTLCFGDAIALTWETDEEINYAWNTGWFHETFFVDQPGAYVLTVSNACGSATDSIDIYFDEPIIEFDFGPDTIICPDQALVLYVPGDSYQITWQDGSHVSEWLVEKSQLYSATTTNACGSYFDEIFIEINDDIPVYPSDQITVICPDSVLILDASQSFAALYQWEGGPNTPQFAISQPGLYAVEVSTSCVIERLEIDITNSDSCASPTNLYFPNVFSPNGDQINDVWIVSAAGNMHITEMHGAIYDRWGNLVYTSDAIPMIWDGKWKDQLLSTGVYTYEVAITYLQWGNQVREIKAGNVTLLR